MTRRRLFAWFFAGIIFASLSALRAQTAATPETVNESKARAVLAGDSIRLQLPFTTPAATMGRAAVWTLSPNGTPSKETSVNFVQSARLVSLVLPWPTDAKGSPVADVGWYRIGYRIEPANGPSSKGILSIGAIAPNLLTLRVAVPEKLVAGKPLSVRVYAGNPVTRRSFRGVHLEGTLNYDDKPAQGAKPFPRSVVRVATTGGTGEAILTYPIQGAPGDTATLTVKGTFTGADGAQITSSINADVEISDRTTVYVNTDKPLHKPGEPVHLRALVLDDSGHAAAGAAMTLTIRDPQSKTVLEQPLTANRFGIASYDWKTGTQLALGNYEANFEFDSSSPYSGSGGAMVHIQRYDLPEFSVAASMDRDFYLDGQTPSVHIHAGYLFGKAVSAGSVRILRAGDHDPKKPEQTAALDEHGDADLRLNVQDDFTSFKDTDYQRYLDIEFRALVTDASTGRTEPRNFTLRLTHYPVHIYLNKMGGNDREGDYIVDTANADGTPAICKVSLDWMDADSHPSRAASVSTNRYGIARVHLRYPSAPPGDASPSFNLRLTARGPGSGVSTFDQTVNADSAKNIWISAAESLLKPDQDIAATVHAQPGSVVDIDVVSGQGLLAHQQVQMTHPEEPLTISADNRFHGVVTLVAYTMDEAVDRYNYRWGSSSEYRSVLYPEDRELKLKLTGLHPSYTPGAAVEAGLDVHAAGGDAAPSALGLSVIDTAVEQRATTEEEAQGWYGWNWWNGYGAGENLNKTDMSQPVSEDLQLAAEVLLQSSTHLGIAIEQDDHNDVRNQYDIIMQNDLKPVGAAVLEARPARFPATLDSVRGIPGVAALDAALLLDPWDTPYRAQTAIEWTQEVLKMVSAGPDKRFGTEDDFSLDIARRNIFALPGERLTKLLRDAVAAGQPLPATVEALKQFSRAAGLDLDQTFAPDGTPYLYELQIGRRFYAAHVFFHNATLQPDGRLSGMEVWTSPSIDYFSRTESRMEAAIGQWAAAGHLFPTTEAEARQAFSAAGIDFDSLRDPLGQHFQLRTAQVMGFTRVERVTAGGATLQAASTPVTHLYRAIQVVRSADGSDDGATFEVVAQFLHPITQQSGSDAKPEAVDSGTFKGNTGAIGGTITDQSGAVIQNASVTIKTADGATIAEVKSLSTGVYLAPDLDGGLYAVQVSAPGFTSFAVTEVRVSAASLTTVDIQLRVGATTETVTVTDSPPGLATSNASLGSSVAGFSGTARKVGGAGGQATITELAFTPRLRHVFEETAYWAPSLETSANGRAALHFNLPDSLTTWKLHAIASTVDGRIGVLDQTFKTFQPFFVDIDAPQVLTVGDEITLPLNLRNYTDHSVALPVVAKPAGWLTLLTPPRLQASVPANGSTPLVFGLRATASADAGPLRITAANAHEGDAVEKTVRIHPDGEPRAVTAAGLLTQHSTTLALDLPADAIPGSIHAELRLYPNLGAHVLHAMKAVLERPYGCGEQTISSTYPSLLYLELLKASHTQNSSTDPIAIEAQTYLQLGHDRLADYFDTSGGLTYWGGNDHAPDAALTAYAIEFLTEAAPYVAADPNQITAAINWLLANQQPDGTWKPHYGSTTAELNLYIAQTLAQSMAGDAVGKTAPPALRDRVNHAVALAKAWAASSAAAVHAPYANALRLRLAELTRDAPAAARLRAELATTAVRDRNGAHWTPLGYSPFYGWGHAGELEATAQVLSALRPGEHSAAESTLLNDALFYLLGNQDRYGIWYSTQATVRVLQALMPLAVQQLNLPAGALSFGLAINGVPLTGSNADALHADPRLLSAPRSLDLTAMLKPGHNELVFLDSPNSAGAGNASLASVEATATFYVPWHGDAAQSKTQPGTDAGLDFGYACAATGAQAGKPIDCTVDARRFGSQSYGMVLAEVGLPPGAEVDRVSLARLLDKGTISRYELQPDRIVFYLWSPGAEGSHFTFRFTPRYAIHAKAAPATLYDYYNPDLKVVLSPQTFKIDPPVNQITNTTN